MTLTKIETEEEFPLRNYRFLKDGDAFLGHGCLTVRPASYSTAEWEKKLDNAEDDLWDRYGILCKDEEGNLYGAETVYIDGEFIPAVWARVEKDS